MRRGPRSRTGWLAGSRMLRRLEIIRAGMDRVVMVDDDEVKDAMRAYFADTHNVAEGAGAVGLAGVAEGSGERGRAGGDGADWRQCEQRGVWRGSWRKTASVARAKAWERRRRCMLRGFSARDAASGSRPRWTSPAGSKQQYVEDCQVCCQPNVLTMRWDGSAQEFTITSELES